jgi:1,4-alpha-glucan branching enzyme
MLRKKLEAGGKRTRVTFTLPPGPPEGDVSVAGTFNGWDAARHPLKTRRDGSRSTSVSLPSGVHQFRYVTADGHWFDDDDADGREGENNVLIV